ncbi:MAG: hypothetical protein KAV82_11255 [Phycisphaerae bacterium]|nr:hypothetical protein [Phycisphaerae bacterium]
MPRCGNYTDEQADAFLREYVYPDEDMTLTFPTDLERPQAATFIRDRFGEKNSAGPTERAMRVARFYAPEGQVGKLQSMLTGNESTDDDLQKSCYLIMAICEFGRPDQQKAAVSEYQRLVEAPVAQEDFETLVETFFSLPAGTPVTKLRDRLSKALQDCQRKGPEEKLGMLMGCNARLLPWVLSAKARKDAIVQITDDAERLERWAAAYLCFNSDASPFAWDEHAGFGLMREGWELGDEAAVTALTATMNRIDMKGDQELVCFQKTRGYRARELFLEALTEEQRDDRDRYARAQGDLIL